MLYHARNEKYIHDLREHFRGNIRLYADRKIIEIDFTQISHGRVRSYLRSKGWLWSYF